MSSYTYDNAHAHVHVQHVGAGGDLRTTCHEDLFTCQIARKPCLYRRINHCNQLPSEKALKEHHRFYFDDEKGVWIKLSEESQSDGSLASSPL